MSPREVIIAVLLVLVVSLSFFSFVTFRSMLDKDKEILSLNAQIEQLQRRPDLKAMMDEWSVDYAHPMDSRLAYFNEGHFWIIYCPLNEAEWKSGEYDFLWKKFEKDHKGMKVTGRGFIPIVNTD